MSIIHKYIIRQILKYLAIVLVMVICIYIAIDFFEKIDDFIEAGLPLSKALPYFIFKIPFIIAQIIPVCLLLAVLITFGLMRKNNEIIALKSCGISIYYLVKPILLLGILAGLTLFLLFEVLVPITLDKANRIWIVDVKKKSLITSKEKNIWLKDNRLITHIQYYHPEEKAVFGISLYYFDKDFKLIKRIDAKKSIYTQNKWLFYDLMESNLDPEKKTYQVTFYQQKFENLNLLPEDLKQVIKKSEEMTFKELLAYIKKIEAEGYDAATYRTDLHAKIAFPFVCIIMCILGTGLAVKGKKDEGITLNIAYGIGIAFVYWIFYSFCISLGYGDMLPPEIAAWIANFVFLCLGFFTLLHAQ
ncbi:MAG: LPS export ABC transporter permease LptG [Desulfobacterales bacterium]|nr:LPS export ABC transporter permease LptG [Desulfobacterales bacterium]